MPLTKIPSRMIDTSPQDAKDFRFHFSTVIKSGISYIFVVIIFSLIYWAAWTFSPDYFIVNSEINYRPIDGTRNAIQVEHQEDYFNIGLDKLNELLETYPLEFFLVQKEIDHVNEQINQQENIINTKIEEKNSITRKNVEKAIEEKTSQLIAEKKELEGLVESLKQKDININPIMKIEIANLEVQIADLSVKIANEKYKIYSEALKGTYDDEDLSHEIKQTNSEIRLLYQRLVAHQKTLMSSRADIYHKWVKLYNDRKIRLGWADFLYFSIVTATTTGYGDIIPNNTVARMLVATEIVLSLIAFGIFMSSISSAVYLKYKSDKSTN